jgi:hypothetical protein
LIALADKFRPLDYLPYGILLRQEPRVLYLQQQLHGISILESACFCF